jgi:hypothetical protein
LYYKSNGKTDIKYFRVVFPWAMDQEAYGTLCKEPQEPNNWLITMKQLLDAAKGTFLAVVYGTSIRVVTLPIVQLLGHEIPELTGRHIQFTFQKKPHLFY